MKLHKERKNDLILILCILAVAGGFLLWMRLKRTGGDFVEVRINGELVQTISLEEEGTYELNDGSNILVIENHSAYMKEADCPDKICVEQGIISFEGQVITCLPNRITVQVVGK